MAVLVRFVPPEPQELDKAAGRLIVLAIVLLALTLLGITALVAALRFGSLWSILLVIFMLPAAIIVSAIGLKVLAQRRRSTQQSG